MNRSFPLTRATHAFPIKPSRLRNRLIIYIFLLMATVGYSFGQTVSVGAVRGNWRSSNRTLGVGATLKAGSFVNNVSRGPGDSITLIDRRGKVLAYWPCNSHDCTQNFGVPAPPSGGESYLTRAVNGIYDWWSSKPGYVSPGTRGDLLDIIVKIDNGKTDLIPFFKTLRKGTYDLQFEPRILKAAPNSGRRKNIPRDARTAVHAKIPWDPASGVETVKVSGLAAGIYKVFEVAVPQNIAWVLVVPAENLEKASNEFSEVTRLADEWTKNGLDSATAMKFRRFYMEYLTRTYLSFAKKKVSR